MIPPILGFIAIARPTFDVPLAESVSAQAYGNLQNAGYALVGSQTLIMDAADVTSALAAFEGQAVDLLVIFQASFADSTMVMDIAAAIDAPLLLWAVPEERTGGRLRLNSFCGINLAGHALTRAGFSYEYAFAPPTDASVLEKVEVLAKAGQVVRRLQGTRIGRVGEHPPGFETCIPNYALLWERFGVEVAQLDLDPVFEGARTANREAIDEVAIRLRGQLSNLDDLDADATHKTIGTYLTLRQTAQAQQLDGFAVRCWAQFFTDLGCAACGSSSMLNEDRIPASCEADVNGTLTQLILQWISDEAVFDTDLVDFDVQGDTAIVWHCGKAPLSMADPAFAPRGTIHSNRRMPLLMEFPLKPGRVTVARISEATGEFRMVIGGGEMLSAPPAYSGTSGTLRFDRGTQSVLNTIMREGLEHHVALAYGEHRPVLRALAQLLKLPILEL